ncbi:MAG: cobaltochelatase CobT-related protein [Lachnospiraceae bacterium]
MQEYQIDEYRLELENRIKNLLWTVSGDYSLDMKPDLEAFVRSKAQVLYDGVKQGAFAKFFDKDEVGLYLVKKIYLQSYEGPLRALASLCVDAAVGERVIQERPGVESIRRKAYEDVLDLEFSQLTRTTLGHLKIAFLREALDGERKTEKQIAQWMEDINSLKQAESSMDIIRVIDRLYNEVVDTHFEKNNGDLQRVLAVTLSELTEFSWKDYLTEEMYEDTLESYLESLTSQMTSIEDVPVPEEEEKPAQDSHKRTVKVVTEESLEKMYSYVELNYGRTYLLPLEEKRVNYHMCRDVHADCSLYFTEGILSDPVRRNYQFEYAKRSREKNKYLYYDKHRLVKRNIANLTETLKKTLVIRGETQEIQSDYGTIVPSLMWKPGRSTDARIFTREIKASQMDFVVDVLIDASGSQRSRQGEVALQGYMISETLSNIGIPHRVMSFCTFWDYTILHRFREYDDPRSANEKIFEYTTSSNNRDGLAIKAAGSVLLQREEEKKIMVILSDGKPYDVIINRPNAKNPQLYEGDVAIRDTAFEVRKLRNHGVSVLGVFAGEEKDLSTEKKIFGKDFAYIRNLDNFSKIVGRYLTKQLEDD